MVFHIPSSTGVVYFIEGADNIGNIGFSVLQFSLNIIIPLMASEGFLLDARTPV